MTEPKRKVLKQSTLVDVFQCQQEISRTREGPTSQQPVTEVRLDFRMFCLNADISRPSDRDYCLDMDSTDDKRRKREQAAHAAERRIEQREQLDCVASQSEHHDREPLPIAPDDPESPLLFSELVHLLASN